MFADGQREEPLLQIWSEEVGGFSLTHFAHKRLCVAAGATRYASRELRISCYFYVGSLFASLCRLHLRARSHFQTRVDLA